MPTFLHRMSGPGTAGDLWISTMHSQSASTLSAVHAAWQTFVTAIHTNSLKALWPLQTAITGVATVQLDPVTGKQAAVTSSSVALSGNGAGQTMSPRDSLVLSKRTATPTKAGRGRMYLPAPDASHLGGTGLLLPADATSIATAVAAALTTFKATSTPVVYHHATKTVDNITYIAVGNVLGTQVRRTNRVATSYVTRTI